MVQTRWKLAMLSGLLVILLIGNTAYARNPDDYFFWSDVVPMPSCSSKPSRGGESGKSMEAAVVKDGKKVAMELPSCEEAQKSRVLVLVNGLYLQTVFGSGAEPFIENGRTMIPLRALADAFGFEVSWEQSEQKITLKNDDKMIILYIGKSDMLVDGEKLKLDEAVPMIKHDLTFLPVRQLAEILGVKVEWDGDTRTATFTDKQ
ncbi:stalk domain-containing protein [Paenibacillus piri]|uniref:stalk domain-containing protein n=1 Tax=Paenibacillus piri TaxID=2547395 RepID=UPI001404D0AE|nr:copper amine oxidase N-terminal domain-containing protein [Paenibacillus piri]